MAKGAMLAPLTHLRPRIAPIGNEVSMKGAVDVTVREKLTTVTRNELALAKASVRTDHKLPPTRSTESRR
jgi:hypothetical protein